MMAEGLNLTLPANRGRRSWGGGWLVVLLLAVLAVGGTNLWLQVRGQGSAQSADGGMSAAQYEQLATKLAARGLHGEAADAWKGYLGRASVGPEEQARVLYRVGVLLLEAGRPGEAIDYLYRSELTAEVAELRGELDGKLAEAFEQAGRFAALRQELRSRASFKPGEDADSVVVAELGPEKITRGQLAALAEKKLESQLRRLSAMMSPEQVKQQKELALGRLTDPKQQLQLLEQVVVEEAMYREALARQLDEEAAVKEALTEQRRRVLAKEMLHREVLGKVQVGEREMETYYEAHRADFVTPARASIRYVAFEAETAAAGFIGRVKGGEDFEAVAAALAGAGQGVQKTEVTDGGSAGSLKVDAAWVDKILQGEAGAVMAEPVGQAGQWYAVWVDEVTAAAQQDFASVKGQIYQMLARQEMQEAQQVLQESLMAKYNIVVHREVFSGGAAEQKQPDAGTQGGQ